MSLHNMHVARMLITAITRGGGGGGSFLILQDVMGWATGFFIPCLGEGQQKTVSTETDFAGPTPLPVLYDQSLNYKFFICSSWSFSVPYSSEFSQHLWYFHSLTLQILGSCCRMVRLEISSFFLVYFVYICTYIQ